MLFQEQRLRDLTSEVDPVESVHRGRDAVIGDILGMPGHPGTHAKYPRRYTAGLQPRLAGTTVS